MPATKIPVTINGKKQQLTKDEIKTLDKLAKITKETEKKPVQNFLKNLFKKN